MNKTVIPEKEAKRERLRLVIIEVTTKAEERKRCEIDYTL